jgi:tRNA(fMet)-specific endonuclease VapC
LVVSDLKMRNRFISQSFPSKSRLAAGYRSSPAKSIERQIESYARLHALLRELRNRKVLDFDRSAAERFHELSRSRLRVGTMDLKIAAIALVNDATLLSRNLSDFRRVPGLRVEDWTAV